MLKLRPATVVETRRSGADGGGAKRGRAKGKGVGTGEREQRLVIELVGDSEPTGAGERREAIADVGLVGLSEVGDEVIVNVQALDLGLGSGGFDVVHVNLTRGLEGERDLGPANPSRAHVMKLNYTSLQHAVEPIEQELLELPLERPVAVLALHGQLAGVAWAFAQGAPGAKLGYVQTEGGALPGGHSHTVRMLRERGLLAGHVTAGASFGRRGDHHGGRAAPWPACARLGCGGVRAGARDRRLELAARAWRDDRAGLRARGAGA
jgi:hypothetical protein